MPMIMSKIINYNRSGKLIKAFLAYYYPSRVHVFCDSQRPSCAPNGRRKCEQTETSAFSNRMVLAIVIIQNSNKLNAQNDDAHYTQELPTTQGTTANCIGKNESNRFALIFTFLPKISMSFRSFVSIWWLLLLFVAQNIPAWRPHKAREERRVKGEWDWVWKDHWGEWHRQPSRDLMKIILKWVRARYRFSVFFPGSLYIKFATDERNSPSSETTENLNGLMIFNASTLDGCVRCAYSADLKEKKIKINRFSYWFFTDFRAQLGSLKSVACFFSTTIPPSLNRVRCASRAIF